MADRRPGVKGSVSACRAVTPNSSIASSWGGGGGGGGRRKRKEEEERGEKDRGRGGGSDYIEVAVYII